MVSGTLEAFTYWYPSIKEYALYFVNGTTGYKVAYKISMFFNMNTELPTQVEQIMRSVTLQTPS